MDQTRVYHFYHEVDEIGSSEPYCSLTDDQVIEAINTLFQLHYDCQVKTGPWFITTSEYPYDGSYIVYGEWLMQALRCTRDRQPENIVVLPRDRFHQVMETFSKACEYRDFCWQELN